MKIKWDPLYLKYTFYASLTILLGIVFYHVADNLIPFLGSLNRIFLWMRRLLSPFIIGGFIAYFLNPGVRWFDRQVFGKIRVLEKWKKLRRGLSVSAVYLIVFGLTITLLIFIVPQIASNIREISRRVPEYIRFSEQMIAQWSEDLSRVRIDNFAGYVQENVRRYFTWFEEYTSHLLSDVVSSALAFTTGVLNVLLGFVISVYLLADKESFRRVAARVVCSLFSPSRARSIQEFFAEADQLFSRYIVGKSLDSLIIGILCFIGLNILNVRYALLLSAIVGVTNMIPYFGPFIGMVPAGILTLFDSPGKALWAVLFILALQQFDGLVLGPRILGNSVGLPPFWIIFSIIVGGKLAGVMGMLLGVPVFGVVWILMRRISDRMIDSQNRRAESCGINIKNE